MGKKSVARKLIKLRKEAGFTQDELSEKTGISQGHICKLELTGSIMSLKHVAKLATAYNLHTDELFKYLFGVGK